VDTAVVTGAKVVMAAMATGVAMGSYTGCGWVNGAWVCLAYGYPYI
jgi:hypothetical protein